MIRDVQKPVAFTVFSWRCICSALQENQTLKRSLTLHHQQMAQG